MQFINASDEEDVMEYVLFPKTYLIYNDLKKGDIIKVEGRVEKRNNYQIIVSKIWRLWWKKRKLLQLLDQVVQVKKY